MQYLRQEAQRHSRFGAKALLNHGRCLRQQSAERGPPAQALLGDAGSELLRQEKRRAQREARALRGYWDRFEVSPA